MGGKTVNGPSVWKAKAVMENMFPSAIPGERAALLVSPRSHSLRAAMLRFAGGPASRCGTSLRHPMAYKEWKERFPGRLCYELIT